MKPEDRIQKLEREIQELKDILMGYSASANFEEKIRSIVMFDRDSSTARTTSISVPAGGGSFNVPKTPDIYIRERFRGTPYNIPAHIIS